MIARPSLADREDVLGGMMLAPALAYVILLVGVPFVFAILLGFSNATAGSLSFGWAGLDNYRAILSDPIFLRALRNSVVVTIGSQVLVVVLATAAAQVFRAAFLNIGVSNCDMATSWLLPRLIGASRAHELMLTGRRVDAREALAIGLVADVVQDGLLERARRGASEIAALAPWGVRLTKQGMWAALEIPSERAAIEYEDRQQIMATFGKAPPEAVAAFLQKRQAEFAD